MGNSSASYEQQYLTPTYKKYFLVITTYIIKNTHTKSKQLDGAWLCTNA